MISYIAFIHIYIYTPPKRKTNCLSIVRWDVAVLFLVIITCQMFCFKVRMLSIIIMVKPMLHYVKMLGRWIDVIKPAPETKSKFRINVKSVPLKPYRPYILQYAVVLDIRGEFTEVIGLH